MEQKPKNGAIAIGQKSKMQNWKHTNLKFDRSQSVWSFSGQHFWNLIACLHFIVSLVWKLACAGWLVMSTDALLLNEQQGYQALLPSSLSGYYGNRKWNAEKRERLKRMKLFKRISCQHFSFSRFSCYGVFDFCITVICSQLLFGSFKPVKPSIAPLSYRKGFLDPELLLNCL